MHVTKLRFARFLAMSQVKNTMDSWPPRNEESDASDENSPLIARKAGSPLQGSGGYSVEYVDTDRNRKGANEFATFFNFVKASIGSGSFALPWGILQAGVLVGASGMVLLAIASVYTMQLMLECRQIAKARRPHSKKLNYTEIGEIAMGPFGKWAVNLSVLACNLGVCAGYLIFISSNLQYAFTCFAHTSRVCFTTWEVYAMVLPCLILLTYLPSFSLLAYAAYIGSVFLAIAMIVVYVFGGSHAFCVFQDITGDGVKYLPESFIGVAQWFGVTAFLFCVHSMVIPLQSAMKRPKNMGMLLDLAALVVVTINLPFALYGYFLFGKATNGYVFQNIPGGVFENVVRLFLSLELSLTFPIVIKPAADIMEEIWWNFITFATGRVSRVNSSVKDFQQGQGQGMKMIRFFINCVLRTLLVLVSWAVAVGIPRFELCLALVGSLATTILAFILPPMFHLTLFWSRSHIGKIIFHTVFLVVGILVTMFATGINLYMAIIQHGSPTTCESIEANCYVNETNPLEHCYSNFTAHKL